MVEQEAVNFEVVSSSLTGGAKFEFFDIDDNVLKGSNRLNWSLFCSTFKFESSNSKICRFCEGFELLKSSPAFPIILTDKKLQIRLLYQPCSAFRASA